ncbi:MAG TPA: hypothetical protein VKX49_26915 [Bryobacteraceae bacterium]|nr:hypothetical protein [Bryobacteraceae bacterium]
MKKTIAMILFAAAVLGAQDRSGNAVQSQKSNATADSAHQLPKGAVQIEPNLYRYTDAQGKTWLIRSTPFGFSKWEDKPAAALPPAQADRTPAIKATDLGQTVRFERPTPFGVSTWVRKKDQLTEEEKSWLETSRRSNPELPSKPAAPAVQMTEKH